MLRSGDVPSPSPSANSWPQKRRYGALAADGSMVESRPDGSTRVVTTATSSTDTPCQSPCTGAPGAFCMVLRRGLRRAHVTVTEVNIWEELAGAAVVRRSPRERDRPTLVVGDQSLVNPSTRSAVEAIRTTP